jgi:hypothetical protein
MAASGKSPIYQFPFPLSTDVVDVSGDIQLLATRLDTSLKEIIEDVVGLMVSANTETGISVTYDDPTGKLNFILNTNYLQDTVAPIVAHDDHIGIVSVYDSSINKVILEVVGGGGSGGSNNASLSDMWWLGV